MPWLLLDVLLGVLALGCLGAALFGVWRKVKELGREVNRAAETIGRATDELAQLQARPAAPRGVG